MLTHYTACLWYTVARTVATEHTIPGHVAVEAQSTTWLHELGLEHEQNAWLLYISCLQWASSQSSVGSTNIHPTNVFEQMFSVGCAACWFVVLTLFITVFGVLAAEIRELNQERICNQAIVRKFLQTRHINESLSKKINHFVRVQADCTQTRM